jgi:hypothetical protein
MTVTVNLTCDNHPKYKAIYKPRADCETCWLIYMTIRAICSIGDKKDLGVTHATT